MRAALTAPTPARTRKLRRRERAAAAGSVSSAARPSPDRSAAPSRTTPTTPIAVSSQTQSIPAAIRPRARAWRSPRRGRRARRPGGPPSPGGRHADDPDEAEKQGAAEQAELAERLQVERVRVAGDVGDVGVSGPPRLVGAGAAAGDRMGAELPDRRVPRLPSAVPAAGEQVLVGVGALDLAGQRRRLLEGIQAARRVRGRHTRREHHQRKPREDGLPASRKGRNGPLQPGDGEPCGGGERADQRDEQGGATTLAERGRARPAAR